MDTTFISRIRPDRKAEITAAIELRNSAKTLHASVSKGSYTDKELAEFLSLANRCSLVLHIANPELAERAGLGISFFSSVVRQARRPRLQNMLKALSTVITVAEERLGEDRHLTENGGTETSWIKNPILKDFEKIESIQRELYALIQHLKSSNSLSEIVELDQYWRDSLIDLLETVIQLLKSPLIERSLLRKAGDALKRLPVLLGEQASAGFIGALATAAAASLLALL